MSIILIYYVHSKIHQQILIFIWLMRHHYAKKKLKRIIENLLEAAVSGNLNITCHEHFTIFCKILSLPEAQFNLSLNSIENGKRLNTLLTFKEEDSKLNIYNFASTVMTLSKQPEVALLLADKEWLTDIFVTHFKMIIKMICIDGTKPSYCTHLLEILLGMSKTHPIIYASIRWALVKNLSIVDIKNLFYKNPCYAIKLLQCILATTEDIGNLNEKYKDFNSLLVIIVSVIQKCSRNNLMF